MSFSLGHDVHLDRPAYVDPTARIYGRVSAGEGSSFWPYSVIRAEGAAVRIGRCCNIQDGAVIHVGGGRGTTIGDYCSIAHRAVVHGAEVGDDCLIGIGAVVMDGAKVGRRCVVGAMALVPPGTEIPEGSVVMGVPGKVVATRDNRLATRRNALVYHRNALAASRRLARRDVRPLARRHRCPVDGGRGRGTVTLTPEPCRVHDQCNYRSGDLS